MLTPTLEGQLRRCPAHLTLSMRMVRSPAVDLFLVLLYLSDRCLVSTHFATGPGVNRPLTVSEHGLLLEYYTRAHPDANVLSHRHPNPPSNANFLYSHANFYNSVILRGRRVVASRSMTSAPNSIVQIFLDATCYVGQVVQIIGHHQTGIPETIGPEAIFLHVRWFSRIPMEETNPWRA